VAARFFPVFAGAALRNKGVQPVMDGIVHFLPSPAEVPPAGGDDPRTGVPVTREPVPGAPFSSLVFKVMIEEGRRTVYLRVYSGNISEGDFLWNASTGEKEKVARLFRIHAGKKGKISKAVAGDIVAIRGIKNARTGDTLCDPEAPILLESIEIRKPVVSVVVEPKTLRDMDRLGERMGELHLEILVDRLGRDFGLPVRTGMPQVVYRETIGETGTAETVFEREIAERLVTVKIAMEVRPGRRGSGIKVSDRLRMLDLSQEVADGVEAGIREGAFTGIFGYPVDDVEAEVKHVEFLSGTATPLAAKVASVMTFLSAYEKGKPYLLEPVMSVDIAVPEEFLGGVIGDINARRGRVTSVDRRGDVNHLSTLVPLKEMFGYVTSLRSLSQGRGTYMMKFSHYDRAARVTP
jgi:elongation factor G